MTIYPAIDIKDGKCVRLLQGRFDDVTVYGDDPVEMALKWELTGAKALHVVDLDGARSGTSINRQVIGSLAKRLKIPVQTGGGIRAMADIEELLALGVHRVILGTAAVKNPDFVKAALAEYHGHIIIGIDAKDGFVAVDGWEHTSQYTAVDFAGTMQNLGAKTIIYTDIATDGMMKGPNLPLMKEMIQSVHMDVIASGGVSVLADLIHLKKIGAAGAITGKAIYTGSINLSEALESVEIA
jgi:phosphoribosylformimino-5-aminoimidazole carboxamide ribotide isomerase